MTTTDLSYGDVGPRGLAPHFDASGTWAVFVRNDDTQELVGEIGDVSSAVFICRFNDVGTWQLQTRATGVAQELVRLQHVSVVLRCGQFTVLSGPLTRAERTYDEDGDRLALYGLSDLSWAAARIVRAVNVDHFWRVGSVPFCLSELMAAFASGADGRTPRIVVAPEPQGPWDAAFAARWQNLLEVMQGVALQVQPTYGFDVRDLVFETWQPTEGDVVFSVELGTMASYQIVAERPDANWFAVLGQGELAARQVYYAEGDWRTWGQIEDVKDRRDVEEGNADALRIAGREALAEAERPLSVRVTPIDTPAQQYGLHYGLGDMAQVTFPDGTETSDTITEVTITMESNKPLGVVPTVGNPQMTLETFRRMTALSRRLSILEAI